MSTPPSRRQELFPDTDIHSAQRLISRTVDRQRTISTVSKGSPSLRKGASPDSTKATSCRRFQEGLKSCTCNQYVTPSNYLQTYLLFVQLLRGNVQGVIDLARGDFVTLAPSRALSVSFCPSLRPPFFKNSRLLSIANYVGGSRLNLLIFNVVNVLKLWLRICAFRPPTNNNQQILTPQLQEPW